MVPPDVFVPGNHEFDFGKDNYFKLVKAAKYPTFAANLRAADGACWRTIRTAGSSIWGR